MGVQPVELCPSRHALLAVKPTIQIVNLSLAPVKIPLHSRGSSRRKMYVTMPSIACATLSILCPASLQGLGSLAFSDEELREIQEHLITSLSSVGLVDVAREVDSYRRESVTMGPEIGDLTRNCFERTISSLESRSRAGYEQALGTLREFVATEQGESLEDVVLVNPDDEDPSWSEISLGESPDVADLVTELRSIMEEL